MHELKGAFNTEYRAYYISIIYYSGREIDRGPVFDGYLQLKVAHTARQCNENELEHYVCRINRHIRLLTHLMD